MVLQRLQQQLTLSEEQKDDFFELKFSTDDLKVHQLINKYKDL